MIAWLCLLAAGACECLWSVGMKYSCGWSRLWPSVFTLVSMALSVWLLNLAMKSLPLGTAYAAWTGIGAVGTAVCGIVIFGESAAWPRLTALGLIVCGIVGLKIFSAGN